MGNNSYTDPCEQIQIETGEESGGSGVPPVPSNPPEYESHQPEYPWNQALDSSEIIENYSRRIYIIDSSNFFPVKKYQSFGLGLRTPAELDFSIDIPSWATHLNRNIESGIARIHMRKEASLRNSDSTTLDVPPRDNFRMMLDRVWTHDRKVDDEPVYKAYIDPKWFVKHSYNAAGAWVESPQHAFIYDYTTPRLSRDEKQPFKLYLWHEFKIYAEENIVPHSLAFMGMRFHKETLKQKMNLRPDYWRSNGAIGSPLDDEGDFIPARISQILDTWFLGPATADTNHLINPRRNWLIDTSKVYEDYVFIAPASYDASYEAFADTKLNNFVEINPHTDSNPTADAIDRQRLASGLSAGTIDLDNLTDQPYMITENQKINLYAYIHHLNLNREGPVNSSQSPVQKYATNNLTVIDQINAQVDHALAASGRDANIKEALEEHVEIRIQKHDSAIASLIQGQKLSSYILDMFHGSGDAKETFTQIIDNEHTGPQLARPLDGDNVKNFIALKKVKDFYFKLQQHADLLKEEQFANVMSEQYPLGLTLTNNVPSKISNLGYKDDINSPGAPAASLRSLLHDRSRNFKSILDGEVCYSEVIAYKVVKRQVSSGEVVQTFYFFNSQESNSTPDNLGHRSPSHIRFLDTQVLSRESYEYSIFTINAVLGSEYMYNPAVKYRDGHDPMWERDGIMTYHGGSRDEKGEVRDPAIDLFDDYYGTGTRLTNHLTLIEAPYYQADVSIGALPPSRPEIMFLPEVGTENKFTLLFQSVMQSVSLQRPIALLKEDEEEVRRMHENQSLDLDSRIKYQSLSEPLVYEALILGTPPKSYSDFAESKVLKTDFRTPYLQFKVDINRNYYVVVRSKDRAGISNPSEVYKIRMESHEDGINPVFEKHEMKSRRSISEINFQNTISIQPAPRQKLFIDPTNPLIERPDFYHSAPDFGTLRLDNFSPGEKPVWDRKFKFRLKSKSSGKSIDINVNFNQEKINLENREESSQIQTEAGAQTPRPVEYSDLSTDQAHRYADPDRDINFETHESEYKIPTDTEHVTQSESANDYSTSTRKAALNDVEDAVMDLSPELLVSELDKLGEIEEYGQAHGPGFKIEKEEEFDDVEVTPEVTATAHDENTSTTPTVGARELAVETDTDGALQGQWAMLAGIVKEMSVSDSNLSKNDASSDADQEPAAVAAGTRINQIQHRQSGNKKAVVETRETPQAEVDAGSIEILGRGRY
jgi:hypothetical protein